MLLELLVLLPVVPEEAVEDAVALSVWLTKVPFAVDGEPVPTLTAVPRVVVTETIAVALAERDESAPPREDMTALTDDADADGANVVLVERAEKKVVDAGGRVEVVEELPTLPTEI